MEAYAESKTPEEERDRRGTPVEIFNCIRDFLRIDFDLDVCADEGNYKIPQYLTKEDDALNVTVPWYGKYNWMNPPYSKPVPWCKKATSEAREGSIVVGLLPDDRSTMWYRSWVYPHASAIYTTSRRVPFLDENGIPQNGNPKGSIIVVWTPWKVDSPAQGMIVVPRWSSKKSVWVYDY